MVKLDDTNSEIPQFRQCASVSSLPAKDSSGSKGTNKYTVMRKSIGQLVIEFMIHNFASERKM